MIRAAALLAAGLAFGGGAAAQVGGDLKPPHVAHVSFEPLEGDGTQIAPGAAFRIAIDVMNAAGADAPAGLTLFGWLRRSDPANLPCTEAAESFFRTGRLPVGAVFLNDPLVAMLTEDDALHLVDPEFSLATANILGAVKLASRPGAVAVDPDLRRLLVLLPEEGRVVAVDTAARQSVLAEGLTRPEAVLPVADGGVIALDAGRLVRRPEGPVPDIEARALVPVPGSSEALALGARAITLFDRDSGAVRLHWDVHASAALPLHGPDGTTGLAAAVGSELLLRYLDAPDAAPLRIPLAAPARALVVSRDGRFVFAHDPAGGPVSVVDLARSRLVQSTGAGATAVSEIVAGDSAAYLMLADQSRVGVLDLVSLARSGHAEFREVPLGAARDAALDGAGYLASLWPDSGVIAVHRESRQGYRLQDFAAMGNAPAMSAIPLRGGVPRAIHVLDRSFREGPTGSFRTVTTLPGPGRWELVATTGLGQLSFCAELPVADPGEATPQAGRLLAEQADGALQLRVVDGAGAPLELRGVLTFAALSGVWRDRAPFRSDATGRARAIYELPPGDPVVLTLEAPGAPSFVPLLVEAD
ncbi:hypothetical protein [Roseivivax marinus]|uniref:hypothetical protein n=1 Tax=Roseivivax marinus TaxID=1379903 RepID=UPI00273D2123|nr:hypothetical protein [Roseivivax marinus]